MTYREIAKISQNNGVMDQMGAGYEKQLKPLMNGFLNEDRKPTTSNEHSSDSLYHWYLSPPLFYLTFVSQDLSPKEMSLWSKIRLEN